MSRLDKGGKTSVLSEQEMKRVVKLVQSASGEKKIKQGLRNATIVLVSWGLGLRAKELAALRLNDVFNFTNNQLVDVLVLQKSQTKGSKIRELPLMNKTVRNQLERFVSSRIEDGALHSDYLFNSQMGGGFSAQSMVNLMKKIYVSCGLENHSSHSGRRGFITDLVSSGIDLNTVRILAGHTDISTTISYVEANQKTLDSVMMNR